MKIHFFYLSIILLLLSLYFLNKPNENCISQCSQDTMYSAMLDIQNHNGLILKDLEMECQAYCNTSNTKMYYLSKQTDSIATNMIAQISAIRKEIFRNKENLEKSMINLQNELKTLEDNLYNGLYYIEKNKDINEKWYRQLTHLGYSSNYLSDFIKLNQREQDEELMRICLDIRHKENYVLCQNKALIASSISCHF